MLRVAVPNKGTLSEPAAEILSEAGYRRRTDTKDLTVVDPANQVEFFFLRPKDIAIYVGSGQLDLGITGRDLAQESVAPVRERLALGFGSSTFRYAAPRGRSWRVEDLEGKRIATAFPNLVRKTWPPGDRGDGDPPRRRRGDLGAARCRRCDRRRGRFRSHPGAARPGGIRRVAVRFRGGADRARRLGWAGRLER